MPRLGVVMEHWAFLAAAIVSDVIATSALKASEGFTRPGPSLVVITGYLAAFYFLALTLRSLSVGVAYAVWSGAGVVLVALVGWLLYGQKLSLPGVVGISLIVAGVVVLNLFSQEAAP